MTAHGELAAGEQPLRIVSILTSALPALLGTSQAPTRYTVPAVFSRQVSVPERTAIEGPETARRLTERGYPQVTLQVSDRRLLIGHTSLEQLEEGLAHELAVALVDIGRAVSRQRDERAAAAAVRQSAESERAVVVQRSVDRIAFE
ncbi:hypothetical protein CHO01_21350 [Cellulomonas hominis]|jgi:hypothetical protein|uniref:Uncharacterized protein n=1 Tax=Cellulomonas hominis TaxID=156981 RepID=A0A511FCN6_9CELL|nr:hypothetical protein [Cellulomonas hominis]MBB5473659.1 hypothetical protein [Cellulomonas hominis]NKY09903.1 hypothetical protein [Cellulomonas hominis]GEL47019.1 hypothetical protein CHO01_21350 [Cellulomonas hominis]